MKAIKGAVTALFLLFAVSFVTQAYAEDVGCGPLVDLRDGIMWIDPAPDNDTEEIQCALEQARDMGVSTVKLTGGLFAISQVQIEDFEGTFEGSGIANTTLFVFDNSIDCTAENSAGRLPAAFKFINGSVKVAKMTLDVSMPCNPDWENRFALIHFTGSSAESECVSETGHGVVDRVGMYAFDANPELIGVAAGAEGTYWGGCKDTQLGTIKLNRSLINGFGTGVDLRMRGAAQVDVNFNEFFDNLTQIQSFRASQLLTIQNNTLEHSEFIPVFEIDGGFLDGTVINSFFYSDVPQDRVVIYNNKITVNSERVWTGILIAGSGNARIPSYAISSNEFRFFTPVRDAILYLQNVSGGSISNNRFIGVSDFGVWLLNSSDSNAQDNVFSGNNFSQFSSGWDMWLWSGTENNIIGPGQGASVYDDGNNHVMNMPNQYDPTVVSGAALPGRKSPSELSQRVSARKAELANQAALKGVARTKR